MAPILREFRPSDLDSLYELDQICFAAGIAYSRAQIAGYVRRPRTKTLIAESPSRPGGKIAGFIIAHCGLRRQGHIITLDVAPEWRRQSVGTLLVDAIESWLRGLNAELVSLETAEENRVAQLFYQRHGYHKLRRLENYYGPGAAAWLMAKPLRGGALFEPASVE